MSITVVATGFGETVPRSEPAPAGDRIPRGRETERGTPFGPAPSFDSAPFEIPSFVHQPEE
jgi:hypothetical protein